MAQKIHVGCHGNICRSPAAEGVFCDLAPDIQTDSTATLHVSIRLKTE